MRAWEFVLQARYEQDRLRLLDYREINIEFKEWMIKLLYEEVKKENEPGEYDSDDDSVCNDRLCDRECLRTEQDQDADPGPDYQDGERAEDGGSEEDGPDENVMEEDIYEHLYAEIDEYKCQAKSRSKKKGHKKKRK